VFPLELSATRSRVAVVGAGPAGLAAAVDLARRGHAVTLFEAGEPGGQFGLAARIPGKEDYALTVSSALAELDVLGAALSFGVTATTTALAKFDGVIVATGVRPRTIDIPGFDLPHVISYEHAIQQGVPDGPVAIIGGGGIGVDVASFLVESHDERSRALEFSTRFGLRPTDGLARPGSALSGSSGRRAIAPRPGSEVTILRRSGKFGQGVGISSRWVVLSNLRAAGVRMLGGVQYRAITPDGVEVESAEGVELVPAHTVIVCAGQVERSGLVDELDAAGIRHLVVGGARHADGVDAVRATSEALAAAREITTASR
jgi:2,4-dienoyl-CoA reductase (NADPH2)